MATLLLVANNGGHLLQLYNLACVWREHDRVWVTGPKPDARSMLAGETVHWAHQPTERNIPNLLRNLRLARRVAKSVRPDWVISTGAGMAVPFLLMGRLAGARLMFIESIAKIRTPTLTGRMVYPFCDAFYVQWPELLPRYPKAEHQGTVYDHLLDRGDA